MIARDRDSKRAIELYNQSLEIAKNIGDQEGIASTLNNMANALIHKEKYEESIKLGSEAYQRLVEKGSVETIEYYNEMSQSVNVVCYASK